jgi:peptide/nickel transport system substrate-binding protein
MPASAPVPKEYAEKYDKENPSTYGEGHAVYTGPYMVENDASGKAIGYEAGRRIHLVRNPNWQESLETRPAYLDEIEIQEGNDDATVSARRVLEGESLINDATALTMFRVFVAAASDDGETQTGFGFSVGRMNLVM